MSGSSAAAFAAKAKLDSSFRKRGVSIALTSGITYGLYTAFMTYAMSQGIWSDWYGANTTGLSAFAVIYLLGALGAAVTDTSSAVWAFSITAARGRIGDFFRTIKTKPGKVMVVGALFGGPIASTAYVIGLQMAGSIIVPISALCPAIGAIIARFLFKQPLTMRILAGIAICFLASLLIASTSLGGDAPEGMALGLVFGFIAAIGWGFEGCVCGYGTSMIDSEVAITIRQVTSGLSNLIILVPIFGMMSGDGMTLSLVTQAFTDSSMLWFAVAGFFAYLNFMLWYKGNGMCGAALGMSCNGAYSFWGPLCCWVILGIFFGIDGWEMQPIAWFSAVLMVAGIVTIAMNPLDLFKKKEAVQYEAA
ncbi:hypothetical protein [Parendozoicomonas haliclonae]|uniref:EamA-like transporter family protein n=1 Tax=Parendozoicomonas haliclonae TaxID=1960125 RepID=A0A1X7AM05_9GAMM|nr:hypothetical protein [Parendozoicomonas haliclonae]SMA46652.1 hypothetical protein EHSB41UT_02225 [Parendozoicomonas haliclonae]